MTTAPQWLLLAHQLPTTPSNARVKTWRRLQQIGAVPTRNAVYVLPNTEQCREDFEWLRSEIVEMGGQATVFAADTLGEGGAHEIIEAFRRSREGDYRELQRQVARLLARARSKRAPRAPDRAALPRAIQTLRERLNAITRIDFFHASGRDGVVATLETVASLNEPARRQQSRVAQPRLTATEFLNRRWITRPRPGVDRMASAWLIRRFIDPKATFAFAASPAPPDLAFDMYEGDFTHQGSMCTFETLAQRFGLAAPALVRIGHIVHDLDMKETCYSPAEAPAVERMVEGLQQLYSDDHVLLEQGITMFEALARSFESAGAERTHRRRRAGKTRKTRRRADGEH